MRVPTHPARPGWSRAHGTRTRQRSLVLCQVKDLVETALLGAVEAAGVFVLAQAGGRTGHAAPRGGRLQLPTAPRPRQPGQHREGRGWHSHRRPRASSTRRHANRRVCPAVGRWLPHRPRWAPGPGRPLLLGKSPAAVGVPHSPSNALTPKRHTEPAPQHTQTRAAGSESELVMGQATRSSVRK